MGDEDFSNTRLTHYCHLVNVLFENNKLKNLYFYRKVSHKCHISVTLVFGRSVTDNSAIKAKYWWCHTCHITKIVNIYIFYIIAILYT